jgi:hypothetical protein
MKRQCGFRKPHGGVCQANATASSGLCFLRGEADRVASSGINGPCLRVGNPMMVVAMDVRYKQSDRQNSPVTSDLDDHFGGTCVPGRS